MNKEKVIQAAERMFMRFGIRSVSMDDLCRELGISKKTLYQFISGKGDLVRKVVRSHIDEEKCSMRDLREQSENAVHETMLITQYVHQIMDEVSPATLYDMKKYYPKAWEEMQAFQREHIYNVAGENLKRGQAEGLYRQNIEPDIIARLYLVKVLAIINPDMFPSDQFNRNDIIRQNIEYHMNGVLSEEGEPLFQSYLKKLYNNE